jgi:hypothetical protein
VTPWLLIAGEEARKAVARGRLAAQGRRSRVPPALAP